MPFVLFVMMLADAGIGMSLVRTPATEREEWSTCFWLSAIFGSVLAVVVMGVIAPIQGFSGCAQAVV
jgi:PST family polysaccharide transporter